jgi:hypothetical protein
MKRDAFSHPDKGDAELGSGRAMGNRRAEFEARLEMDEAVETTESGETGAMAGEIGAGVRLDMEECLLGLGYSFASLRHA